MRKGENALQFRPEFRWPVDKESKPFYTIPAWWRRFIFQVLGTRDLTVYHYYLSVMNTAGVAFPTPEQILGDLGLKDGTTLRTSQKKLTDLGFLIAPTNDERAVFSLGERPIYQRPCVQYTIRELLRNSIDGELYPKSNVIRTTLTKSSDSVVDAGIHTMLGDEGHQVYKVAFDATDAGRDKRLTSVLEQLLIEDLDRRKEAIVAAAKAKVGTFNLEDLINASPAVKALFVDATTSAATSTHKRRKLSRKKK